MQILKAYTKKLLKDLDNPDLWEDTLYCVKHKREGFEVWYNPHQPQLIWQKYVQFNFVEKWLITRKVRKLKKYLQLSEQNKNIPSYFLNVE